MLLLSNLIVLFEFDNFGDTGNFSTKYLISEKNVIHDHPDSHENPG